VEAVHRVRVNQHHHEEGLHKATWQGEKTPSKFLSSREWGQRTQCWSTIFWEICSNNGGQLEMGPVMECTPGNKENHGARRQGKQHIRNKGKATRERENSKQGTVESRTSCAQLVDVWKNLIHLGLWFFSSR
jgi:hypothetical protein